MKKNVLLIAMFLLFSLNCFGASNFYKILGLKNDATFVDISKAYRMLARKFHPDISSEKNAKSKFQEIQSAYEVLSDPLKKSDYDSSQSVATANYPQQSSFDQFQGFGVDRRFNASENLMSELVLFESKNHPDIQKMIGFAVLKLRDSLPLVRRPSKVDTKLRRFLIQST